MLHYIKLCNIQVKCLYFKVKAEETNEGLCEGQENQKGMQSGTRAELMMHLWGNSYGP